MNSPTRLTWQGILLAIAAIIAFTIFFYYFVTPVSVDPASSVPTPTGPTPQIGFTAPFTTSSLLKKGSSP